MARSPDVEVFREARLRRAPRQAVTIARAVRAGRARAKASPLRAADVDGASLRDLVAEVAADAELVDVPVNRPPWKSTRLEVAAGDQVTWLGWGLVHLIKPLGLAAPSRVALGARVAGGAIHRSPRDTLTFTADRGGPVELGSLFPAGGEVRPDGSVKTDRAPYRVQGGGLAAVVVRWAPGTDPRAALESLADRDASGLCAAEAARLADPPQPPPGWEHHPLLPPEDVYTASAGGIVTDCRQSGGIVRRPAEVPLTPTLRLRWSWRLDALPSQLPEDTMLTHDYLSVALEFDDGQDLSGSGAARYRYSPTAARSITGATARRTSSRALARPTSAAGSRKSGPSSLTISRRSAVRRQRASSAPGSSRSASSKAARPAVSSDASSSPTAIGSSACFERRPTSASRRGDNSRDRVTSLPRWTSRRCTNRPSTDLSLRDVAKASIRRSDIRRRLFWNDLKSAAAARSKYRDHGDARLSATDPRVLLLAKWAHLATVAPALQPGPDAIVGDTAIRPIGTTASSPK